MADRKKPTEISDDALDGAQGGAETVHLKLTANGTDIKGDASNAVRNAGLRSDGELVQAKKIKGSKILEN
ncbi:MAG: hypothetical protein AAGE80_04885 [Pseudomonadota bacterium]